MTIAVAALHKGGDGDGIVMGAESMLSRNGHLPETIQKLFVVPRKQLVVSVAGDLRLSWTTDSTNERHILDFPELVNCAMETLDGPPIKILADCVGSTIALARFLPQPRTDLQILVGVKVDDKWELATVSAMLIDGDVSGGIPKQAIFSGIGTYLSYESDAKNGIVGAPPLPTAKFDDREKAEAWVRAVIAWCCKKFPNECGGDVHISTL